MNTLPLPLKSSPSLEGPATGGLDRLIPVPDEEDGLESGPHLALLSGTRSAFRVSSRVHQALASGKPLDARTTDKVGAEIRRLEGLGFWPVDPPLWELSERHRSLSLHLAHECNLACPYCNVQQGTYGEAASRMPEATARAGVDYLRSMAGDRSVRLVFYGGEPLLNWEVLTRAVAYAEEVLPSCAFEIITNGTLLNAERAAFLAAHQGFTVLSLDGPREVHDRNRPLKTGGGSYDLARRGLEYLKQAKAGFHLRATWVPGIADYERVHDHLAGLAGDAQRVTVALEFEQAGSEGVFLWNERLCDQYREARQSPAPLPSGLAPFLDSVLRADLAPVARCEAGHAGFSVTPDGTLYPCQVSASLKRFPLGNVWEGIHAQGRKGLEAFLHPASPVCETCWARTFCAGPCPYSAPVPQDWPYCRTIRLQVRQALAWAAETPSAGLAGARPEEGKTARDLARAAALGDLLWKQNAHIRPLALYPQPDRAA